MNSLPILFFRRLLFVLAVVAISACSSNPARPSSAEFGAAWQPVSCKTFDVPDAIAVDADCGYVTTPEQHAQPKGPTIQLAVVRVRNSSNAPAPDPLFVEQGGPGDTTIGVFVNFALPMKSPGLINILKGRDLLFVEERGTRYSKPFLSCPEINAHNVSVAKGEIAPTDPGWIQACNARFKASGINPNAFNTRENATDIFYVAENLGYREFNFYGGSYGTLLGQYVTAQAGQHKAKLRSAILDGVVRPDIDFNLGFSHTISRSLRNVFNDCALDLRCSQTYPDLEQKFLAIVDQLNQKPLPITLTVPSTKQKLASKLDGNGFLDGILSTLYRTEAAHTLPKLIYAANRGDFGWIEENLSGDLEPDNAKEMYNTVLCARTKSLQVTPSQVLPAPYPQMMAIAKREADMVRNACDVLNVDLKPPFAYENPNIPVLVLNGAYDPATPQPYGEAVAKNFKTAYSYTFPAVGHISLILKPDVPAATCSAQIAVAFLGNPNQSPDSSCITQIKPVFLFE
jgi:pimeloyl-ACP methyl ester carboxylesterase